MKQMMLCLSLLSLDHFSHTMDQAQIHLLVVPGQNGLLQECNVKEIEAIQYILQQHELYNDLLSTLPTTTPRNFNQILR